MGKLYSQICFLLRCKTRIKAVAKQQSNLYTSVFQNVNQAAAEQTYVTLWSAAKPKQVMCLIAYACP